MSRARDQRKAGREFLRDESGQSLVEFAFSTILLLVVVFGVVDLSRGIVCGAGGDQSDGRGV